MTAHIFTPTADSKSPCEICGKTRNTKAHKDARLMALATEAEANLDPATVAAEEEEAAAVAEAREDMLPEASDATDDAEIADALAALEDEAEELVKEDGPATASIWVGWRITDAAMMDDNTLADKLKAAKPTGDLDRTVKLTRDELEALDAIAAKFMEPGHTGPEQYSGRALRGRIATAIAKIEDKK